MSRTKLKPKRLADFPKPYRDAFAHWHAFRKLGFSSDDLFFGFGTVDGATDTVHLQLKSQGETFTVIAGRLPGHSYKVVTDTWGKFAILVNDASDDDRERCFRDHLIGQSHDYFMTFALAIQAKGILVPEIVSRMPHAGQA